MVVELDGHYRFVNFPTILIRNKYKCPRRIVHWYSKAVPQKMSKLKAVAD